MRMPDFAKAFGLLICFSLTAATPAWSAFQCGGEYCCGASWKAGPEPSSNCSIRAHVGGTQPGDCSGYETAGDFTVCQGALVWFRACPPAGEAVNTYDEDECRWNGTILAGDTTTKHWYLTEPGSQKQFKDAGYIWAHQFAGAPGTYEVAWWVNDPDERAPDDQCADDPAQKISSVYVTVVAPTLDIYAPDDQYEFRRGCNIWIRFSVNCYTPADVLKWYVDGDYKGEASMFWPSPWTGETYVKFQALWGASATTPGPHTIAVKLFIQDQEIASDTQQVRIFAMSWPEASQIYGAFNPPDHKGIDMWWSAFDYNPAGVPTINPINASHGGTYYRSTPQPSGIGGYRFWQKLNEMIRIDFAGFDSGIPTYETKYIFTYYCHLNEDPDVQKRENNSGNASGTGSHLHFSVYKNSTNSIPDYEDSTLACDPEEWLYHSDPIKRLVGTVKTSGGQAIGGVKLDVTPGGEATTEGSGGVAGHYRVHAFPGTYTITPSKSGYTFTPSSAQVTVSSESTPSEYTRDFVGSQ